MNVFLVLSDKELRRLAKKKMLDEASRDITGSIYNCLCDVMKHKTSYDKIFRQVLIKKSSSNYNLRDDFDNLILELDAVEGDIILEAKIKDDKMICCEKDDFLDIMSEISDRPQDRPFVKEQLDKLKNIFDKRNMQTKDTIGFIPQLRKTECLKCIRVSEEWSGKSEPLSDSDILDINSLDLF